MPASVRETDQHPIQSPSETDRKLLNLLALRSQDDDFWSSKERDRADSGHGIFQYPAMMVPKVQRRLLGAIAEANPLLRSLYDPFVGSGTSLVSAMQFGFDVYGNDINPLAVLLSRVRTAKTIEPSIAVVADQVVARAENDAGSSFETTMRNRSKWFHDEVALELSRLRRSIRACTDLWVRRFLWATLAETIRLTSNDRTSTYKLHARKAEEIAKRKLSPLAVFAALAKQNAVGIATFRRNLESAGWLSAGAYRHDTQVALSDTRGAKALWADQTFDLIMTSPPYGDNITTVTYGQHSYLPLHWIDFCDIDSSADEAVVRTTHELDARSLGGRRDERAWGEDRLFASSPLLSHFAEQLSGEASDGRGRLTRFYGDFAESLLQITGLLAPGGYMIWTVGNRNICGRQVPTDAILTELLEGLGCKVVTTLRRRIHHKRMPDRNASSATMREEQILLVRRSDR